MNRYIRFASDFPHPAGTWKIALCCPECEEYCRFFWDSEWMITLGLWQSTSQVQSDGHQYTSSWWFSQVWRSPKVLVEHSCLHKVFAEFIVGFSISSLTSGFPMFRTLTLASTVAKDKHRPDNKYLVIAHQEATQNLKLLRLFLVHPKGFSTSIKPAIWVSSGFPLVGVR